MNAIDKSFGSVTALSAAHLEIMPAEVMALVGQNGAGKSTMIKILNGAFRLDRGSIQFDGKPWAAGSPQQAQRAGVSTIFQEINLIAYRTVAENIYLGRELKRFAGLLDWEKMNQGARALLARFSIELDVTKPLGDFSTTIQQMVAIARAVSFDAKLVIMDEPTSSLDEAEVAVLLNTVRQLKSEGVAVVFVSHKLDELYAVCDRVTVMRDGRTVAVSKMAAGCQMQALMSAKARSLGLQACLDQGAPKRPAPSLPLIQSQKGRFDLMERPRISKALQTPLQQDWATVRRTARFRASFRTCRLLTI